MSESTSSCACGANSGSCSTPAPAAKTTIQNGKGDAPRNISESFRRNFDRISWGSSRSQRVEGRRTVKVY